MKMADRSLRQYVWDAPTRLFHWMLVGLIGFSWWSAETHHMDWHQLSGLTVCGLLVFRLLWGLVGTSTARFSRFVKGPRGVLAYLRAGQGAPPVIGHNPLGSWSVVLLLLVLAVQVGSGLLSVDIDGIESGPLSYLVDFDHGRTAAAIHAISFQALEALVLLHVAAILFYLAVRRKNLIHPMITGFQKLHAAGPIAVVRGRWWALAGSAGIAAATAWWISGGARF